MGRGSVAGLGRQLSENSPASSLWSWRLDGEWKEVVTAGLSGETSEDKGFGAEKCLRCSKTNPQQVKEGNGEAAKGQVSHGQ